MQSVAFLQAVPLRLSCSCSSALNMCVRQGLGSRRETHHARRSLSRVSPSATRGGGPFARLVPLSLPENGAELAEQDDGAQASSSQVDVSESPRRILMLRFLTRSRCCALGRFALMALFTMIVRATPLLAATVGAAGNAAGAGATGTGLIAGIHALVESSSFLSGLAAAFVLVLASEIGDKTFFISALLSMKYSRVLVLAGTMLALAGMTIISVGIGQVFHALPASLNATIPFDDYAAVALLLWFGFQSIRDGLAMRSGDDDELQDARDVVAGKQQPADAYAPTGVRVVAETSSLIFLAEWGDKSMLATVALAAAKSPLGVIVGGISGHLVASIIAVIGGSFLGRFISERTARLIGGVLFFVFAFLTIFGIY